jgi:hypothetical protein
MANDCNVHITRLSSSIGHPLSTDQKIMPGLPIPGIPLITLKNFSLIDRDPPVLNHGIIENGQIPSSVRAGEQESLGRFHRFTFSYVPFSHQEPIHG